MATARRPRSNPTPEAPATTAAKAPPRRSAVKPKPLRAPTPKKAASATNAAIDLTARLQFEYVDINDIQPYAFNARHNEEAVPAVAKSIQTFGFLVPVVLDANNVLAAGHTRVEAAKSLGLAEVPAVRAEHLTPEQIDAFRLIDNKVSEIATWDFDLLAGEIGKLDGLGLDWTEFGWTQGDIDCLTDVVAADCLEPGQMVETGERAAAGHGERRAPSTVRLVLGEFVTFVPVAQYRNWIDGLRQLHNFDEDAIGEDIKRRLGMLS